MNPGSRATLAAVAGFFGVAVYTVMFCQAMGMAAQADLGQVNLLNYLWPMWMAVLGLTLLDEPRRPAPIAPGGALVLSGMLADLQSDEVGAVYEALGCRRAASRVEGEWEALLFVRDGLEPHVG